MKVIGLLGGMSWESTRTYYNHLNTLARERLGGLNSARVLLSSVNFAPLEEAMGRGDWDCIAGTLCHEARQLEAGGAECLLLCTNTMHKLAPAIEAELSVPFLHIADALGRELSSRGIDRVGLLGTRFTMVEDFYSARLQEGFGIGTLIPDEDDIAIVDRVIFEELCLGVVRDESRGKYLGIMEKLMARGAGSIALACTEIEMLVTPETTEIPCCDTTYLHALDAVNWAMGRGDGR